MDVGRYMFESTWQEVESSSLMASRFSVRLEMSLPAEMEGASEDGAWAEENAKGLIQLPWRVKK